MPTRTGAAMAIIVVAKRCRNQCWVILPISWMSAQGLADRRPSLVPTALAAQLRRQLENLASAGGDRPGGGIGERRSAVAAPSGAGGGLGGRRLEQRALALPPP